MVAPARHAARAARKTATTLGKVALWGRDRPLSEGLPSLVAEYQDGGVPITTATQPWLVRVGDASLCVQSFGTPGDPPILLIAGAASSMDWWDDALCERIAAGGRYVLRYDHRDTGASTTFPPGQPPYDGNAFSRDAAGLLEALNLPATHLAGVSMGGGIAQEIALRHPDRVASLTLLSTGAIGGVDRRKLPGMSEQLEAAFAQPPPDPDWRDENAYADWILAVQKPFAGGIPIDDERVRGIARRTWRRARDVAAAANHWQVLNGPGPDQGGEAGHDVKRISAPALVIHGQNDPFFPLPHGQALADAIPQARLLVIPGMGHEIPPPPSWDVMVPALLRHTSEGWPATADRLAQRALAADEPTAWFERLYSAARRGEVPMPWDRAQPNPALLSWADQQQLDGSGRCAVVVGCGLGADAELLAARGFRTTAFDISDSAVAEARGRHPGSAVSYLSADLLAVPASWRQAFDLVVDVYTVQAMPPALRERATAAVGGLVARGGSLVVISATRQDDAEPPDGPPWPLSPGELDRFASEGLTERSRTILPGLGPSGQGARLVLERG